MNKDAIIKDTVQEKKKVVKVVKKSKKKSVKKVDNRAKRRAGFYFENEQPFVSVTNLLGIVAKPALRFWSNKQVYLAMAIDPGMSQREAMAAPFRKSKIAMRRGTEVHAIVENYKHTKRYMEGVSEPYKKYAQAFHNWVTDNNVEVLVQEKSLISKQYGFAGTFDLLVRFKNSGRVFVIDIKTGKNIYNEVFLQLSAYRHVLNETGVFKELGIDPKIVGIAVCNLETGADELPTGNYQFKEGEDCFPQFLAAKFLWEWKNQGTIARINKKQPDPAKHYIPTNINFETGKEVKNE